MSILSFALIIVIGTPIPLLVLYSFIVVRRAAPRLLNPIRMASLACLIASLGFHYSGARFTDGAAGFIAAISAIGSYCFLSSSAFDIPSTPLRAAALFTLGAPACIVTVLVAVSSLLNTDAPPDRTEQMRPGLVCKEGGYGMVGAGGDQIGLYKSWPGFPLIEKRVAGDQSDDSAPKAQMSSCADLLRQYDGQK